MTATLVAIFIANSPLAHAYHELLEARLTVSLGPFVLNYPVHHWINDGLMSVFFFMVGLEIKRELLVGELSSIRKATLPAIAALGGMVVPALAYASLNHDSPTSGGWGIPMATDIAFALGALAILGNKVPIGAKVFLTALAIVDDIGAVVVIAIFYTSDMNLTALGIGLAVWAMALAFNKMHVRHPFPYILVGTVMWIAFLESGVHATIAALLMAFAIPARTRIDGAALIERVHTLTADLERIGAPTGTQMNSPDQERAITEIASTLEHATAPLQRIERDLHEPVIFLVLPAFALANAGVTLHGDVMTALTSSAALGIIFGLFVGKQVGITLATWLAVKLRVADLPSGVGWRHIHGVNVLGGIGFTMSLFIAGLAFAEPAHMEEAKIGILVGSLISGVVGSIYLSRMTVNLPSAEAASQSPKRSASAS